MKSEAGEDRRPDLSPGIELSGERRLIGIRQKMSLNCDTTFELFRRFGPRRKEIAGALSADTFCVRTYPENAFSAGFTADTVFEKWAAVEAGERSAVPAGMEELIIPAGKYAVYVHKGRAETYFQTTWPEFSEWLEVSGFEIDDRPHFEIMPPGYRPDNDSAEEEFWCPVRTVRA